MFKPPADLPNIEADYEKVLRVVNNLVDNAFNYTPSGGSIDITVKPDHEKNLLMVSVTDTGVGIPKEFYEHIWQRFERHDETALSLEVAGTGLGLAIVREMVNMHGGNVGFESEVGVGSTFYFSLPIQQPDYMKGVATLANGSN